mgnify:CR=1 FL=1
MSLADFVAAFSALSPLVQSLILAIPNIVLFTLGAVIVLRAAGREARFSHQAMQQSRGTLIGALYQDADGQLDAYWYRPMPDMEDRELRHHDATVGARQPLPPFFWQTLTLDDAMFRQSVKEKVLRDYQEHLDKVAQQDTRQDNEPPRG